MIAIIAEKPSLARNILAGIGEMKKKNGGLFSAAFRKQKMDARQSSLFPR